MHIEPDHIGLEDVHQPGGGDGRGDQEGLDGDHHQGGQDVLHGGLGRGGAGEEVGVYLPGRKERGRRIDDQYQGGDCQELCWC